MYKRSLEINCIALLEFKNWNNKQAENSKIVITNRRLISNLKLLPDKSKMLRSNKALLDLFYSFRVGLPSTYTVLSAKLTVFQERHSQLLK